MISSHSNYIYYYNRNRALFSRIAVILIAISILTITRTFYLVSGIILLAAIAFFMYRTGIEVDFTKKRYRLISRPGSPSEIDWNDLPPLQYVSIFRTTYARITRGRSNIGYKRRYSVIQVNLITAKNNRITVFETYSTEEAFECAALFAKHLQLRIWDATEKTGKWKELEVFNSNN